MKKQEALNHIRKHKGFVPYVIMFDLYKDDDEIPTELIDLFCADEPDRNFIICSPQLAEALNTIINEKS